ncbi:hypothetical protein PUNSTDRAFT_133870 [Punctularia strigosozonata HHB-11173 SS5]|uniref:uncharacterized protein n=1 Tax=Punctularia strigosozonata (strain HHB-11173) TaxID=741275 RepID=UPI00044170FE|nr:uncharacterized protein PUNSTDRAFT_133870 [Punctularia strigosozonata HHB-11173 SS5]EIN10106.1 hypothetical protein PUNSTDRAFT_133870 [Punctularia strigosozonata HHB-11173 SS5]
MSAKTALALSATKVWSRGRYRCVGRISTSRKPTYGLAFSPDATLLASGGKGGIRIHCVRNMCDIETLPSKISENIYGAVTELKWVRTEGQSSALIIGTKGGFVFVWGEENKIFKERHSWRLPQGGEILSLAVNIDPRRVRLAVGTIDRILACYDITAENLGNAWSASLDEVEPRRIEFASNGRDVTILGTFSGQIHTYHKREQNLTNGPSLSQLIGHGAMDKEGNVVIDNTNNFSLHDPGTGSLVAMYSAGSRTTAMPNQVAFGEDGAIVVAGSDTGNAYVFQRTGGGPEQILLNSQDGATQIVTTGDSATMHYIACATSSVTGTSSISIWKCKRATLVGDPEAGDRDETKEKFWHRLLCWITKLVMVIVAVLGLLVGGPLLWFFIKTELPIIWIQWSKTLWPYIVMYGRRIAQLYGLA